MRRLDYTYWGSPVAGQNLLGFSAQTLSNRFYILNSLTNGFEVINPSLNNFAAAKEINDKLLDAYDLMFSENNPAGVKAFMSEMALIQNRLRLPLVPLSESWHSKVKETLGL